MCYVYHFLSGVVNLRSASILHGCWFVKIYKKPKRFSIIFFSLFFVFFNDFVVISFINHNKTALIQLGPKGLKVLLHILDTIVALTKRCFSSCFTQGRPKSKYEVSGRSPTNIFFRPFTLDLTRE